MDRVEQRMRTVQGLRWLEAELRELVDMAKFGSEAEQRLFRLQLKRIGCQINAFESDLVDLLTCYPEAQDTDPLNRLLEARRLTRKQGAHDPQSGCNPAKSN